MAAQHRVRCYSEAHSQMLGDSAVHDYQGKEGEGDSEAGEGGHRRSEALQRAQGEGADQAANEGQQCDCEEKVQQRREDSELGQGG